MEYHASLRADAAVPVDVLVDIASLTDPRWTATAWHHAGPPFASLGGGSVRLVTVELRSSGRVGWLATAELHRPVAEAGNPAKSLAQAVLVGVTAFAPPG